MNPRSWLYLQNLIEVLQDEVKSGKDPVVTAQFVHDLMNDPDEEPIPEGEEVL